MHESSDLDLIIRAQRGDPRAFRDLVVKYQQLAYAVAYRFVGNSMEAEDVTQEVFLKLWKNLGKYRADSKLTTWLYKIITNQCLDHLKSVSRKQQRTTVEIKPSLGITDEATHEKQLDDREMLRIITALAQHLTPRQQLIFVLRDQEGLSVEEVCHVLNMKAECSEEQSLLRQAEFLGHQCFWCILRADHFCLVMAKKVSCFVNRVSVPPEERL